MEGIAQRPRQAWQWWLLMMAALATGAWLRMWQLSDQILVEDEWHALHKLLGSSMGNIATHFGTADYCIPLTLYYRALYDLGWLSEWPMRLPLLLAGLAILLVPPACRRLPVPTRALWAGLLAISPMLIYFSRTARPYALNCLLVMVAVVAVHTWWRRGQNGWGSALAYIVATVLAGWLHLLTLVFTTLPFVWFGVKAIGIWQKQVNLKPFIRLLVLGVLTLLPLLALLLPPLITDWQAMRSKAGGGAMSWNSAWHSLLMTEGSANYPLILLMIVFMIVGSIYFWRRWQGFSAYVLFIALAGTVLIVLAEPNWIQHPGVLVRYVVPVIPVMLLLVAQGSVSCFQLLKGEWLIWPASILFLATVYCLGPLGFMLYNPNQFMGHTRFLYDPDPLVSLVQTQVKLNDIPDFYFMLAKLPPRSVTVVEAPWRLESQFNPLPWYQQLDHQYRKIGMVSPVCGFRRWGEYQPDQRGIHLTQFVHLGDILTGHRQGADFLVLHMKPWSSLPPQLLRWPDMKQCLAIVSAKLGPPIYRDARIAAFDLR